ncbi:unnamed protein product [Clonostachys chloroleuca]|uniref:Uncharacterized protein n=1 Tax=Clonostachys chloroleuca TaxID=1926264 RepID=A0AA35VJA2_9HYPO|nr:unnamed protein product [Clonostachys chloroleuca]
MVPPTTSPAAIDGGQEDKSVDARLDTSGGSDPDSGRDPDACKIHKAVAIWQFRTAGTCSV